MSGHSKWSTIKRQKAVVDAKRGKIFTKLSKNISLAAKNGKDPEMNPALRQAIDTARGSNMPKDNIEKAILRGAGELPGQQLEEVTYEIYAPGGVAMIVKAVTDNTNRIVAEIKAILNKRGGKLASPNAVAYMFKQKGVIRLENANEEKQLLAIDSGADDVVEEEGGLTIYTQPQKLEEVKKALGEVDYSGVELVPDTKVEGNEKVDKLVEAFEENEDVDSVYTNAL